MTDEKKPSTGKLLDLEAYRKERLAEGSWPPPSGSSEYHDYWSSRKGKRGK